MNMIAKSCPKWYVNSNRVTKHIKNYKNDLQNGPQWVSLFGVNSSLEPLELQDSISSAYVGSKLALSWPQDAPSWPQVDRKFA